MKKKMKKSAFGHAATRPNAYRNHKPSSEKNSAGQRRFKRLCVQR